MPHIVKFRESESGWGSETWFRGYDTEEEAKAAEKLVNDKNTAKTAPPIYTTAHYEGVSDTVPEGYKN